MITKLRRKRQLKRLMRIQACFWLINEKYDDSRPFGESAEKLSCEFLNRLPEADKKMINKYASLQAEIFQEYAKAKREGLFGISHINLPEFLCKLLKINEVAPMSAQLQINNTAKPINREQIKLIHTLKNKIGLDDETYRAKLNGFFNVRSSKDLSYKQAMVLIGDLQTRANNMETTADPATMKKYDHLGNRTAFYATPAQLRLIDVHWSKVSYQDTEEKRDAALKIFLQNKFKIPAMENVQRGDVQRVLKAIKSMEKK